MFILERQVQQNEIYFKDTTLCGIFLDNHDQDRFLNHTQNPIRIQNALVYLMFSDGIPIIYMGTEQNFTGNPNVENGATDPWNREALWRSNYDQLNWIYKYLTKLNQIHSSLNQLFFISHQQTIHIDISTYVYQKDSIIIVISNEPFYYKKYIVLPTSSTSYRWKDLISNKIIKITINNLLIINDWNPMILIPVSSSTTFSLSYFIIFILLFYSL